MRICLICTEKLPVPPVRGGAIQIYIDGVVPWLRERCSVTVLSRLDRSLPQREERGGVHFVRIQSGSPDEYVAAAALFLRHAPRFDIILLFNRPAFVPQLADAGRGARLFLSLHNEMLAPDRITADEVRAVLRRVEGVVAISDFIRRRVEQTYPELGVNLRTVRSGVDIAQIEPWFTSDESWKRRRAVRRGLGLSGRKVVLHISRFSPKKGNHLVVEAMEQVLQVRPDAALLLVGSTRYGSNQLDAYGQMIEERTLALPAKSRCMTGFLPPSSIADILPAGDLFICASQWEEPLARVHYEAMAAGLPIITTDRGGNGEVVTHGESGLIARPFDQAGPFAAHMIRLMEDPALCLRLGLRGRAMVEERHTWRHVADSLLQFLEGR